MKILWCAGGLGNQMFFYAFYTRFRKQYPDLYADLSYFKTTKKHNGYELQNIFNCIFEPKIPSPVNIIFHSNFFSKACKFLLKKTGVLPYIYEHDLNKKIFQVDPFIKTKKIIVYAGYWQSERYFKTIENEIRKTFIFPAFTDEKNLTLCKKIQNSNSVSVHIRRGDYLDIGNVLPIEYYKKATALIKEKVTSPLFVVFSDDIPFCKEKIDLFNNETIFVDWNTDKDSFRDMQLMSLCKHNIIPNSSFSWWAAWLNSNTEKKVIAPKKWFLQMPCSSPEYILPEDWIVLSSY